MDDIAMGNLNYERTELDFYPTPTWCSMAVIDTLFELGLTQNSSVWEPACGIGSMSEILKKSFKSVTSTDLMYRGYGLKEPINFLEYTKSSNYDIIITNPPYGNDAENFIRKALLLQKQNNGKVAMFMRNEYDCAKGRHDLWEYPFACKLVLTSRPRWIENSTGAPRHNYAWYIWDFSYKNRPFIKHHIK